MIPRKEQEEAIVEVLASKRHLCRGEVGSGKTLIGVEAVLRSKAKISIVIAPINTFAGWRKTFERQSRGKVSPSIIDNKVKAGKLAFQALAGREPGVYLLSWETFRMYDWSNMPLDFVIADEVHRQQNRNAVTHTAVKTTRHAEYALALSATPWGNRIEGAWATLRWLWWGDDEVVGRNQGFWNWVTRHLNTELDQYAGKKITGERVQGSVWGSVPSKSFFPSPFQEEPIIHEIEVDLTAYQRKIYDKFEQEAIVWLEDNPLIAEQGGVQRMRLREICLAVPSIKEGWVRKQDPDTLEWEKVWGEIVYFKDDAKSTKADAIINQLNDLYAEAPYPILIFTHSRKFATMLTNRLKAKQFRAEHFIGGMTNDEREWRLTKFGTDFDIMVATISSIGTGTDGLQDVCWTEFWVSLDDNRILNEQTIGRLSRNGQKRTVQRFIFMAKNTVEVKQKGKLDADAAQLNGSFKPQADMAAA
jgi:superfamily II DNA or RNA helicase